MRNKFMLALALGALSLAGTTAQAQTSTWSIDPAHSSVGFQIRHMGVSNVRGSIGGGIGGILPEETFDGLQPCGSHVRTASLGSRRPREHWVYRRRPLAAVVCRRCRHLNLEARSALGRRRMRGYSSRRRASLPSCPHVYDPGP